MSQTLPNRPVSWAEKLWVVPDVYARLNDILYQTTIYKVFHQNRPARWLSIPLLALLQVMVFCWLGQWQWQLAPILAGYPDATAMNGGIVYLLLLTFVAFTLNRSLLLFCLVLAAGPLWCVSNQLLAADSSVANLGLTGVLGAALLLAITFLWEPLAPAHSQRGRFLARERAPLALQLKRIVMIPWLAVLMIIVSPVWLSIALTSVLARVGFYTGPDMDARYHAKLVLATGVYDPDNHWQKTLENEWEVARKLHIC